VVYNPRDHVAEMNRAMQRWMSEHPPWPPRGLLTPDQTQDGNGSRED
jgi:hypothetical protein